MRLAIKILSIVSVVLGSLAILGAAYETTTEGAVLALIGGGFFLAYGICSLIYIKNKN
jgi:hypothetical protein